MTPDNPTIDANRLLSAGRRVIITRRDTLCVWPLGLDRTSVAVLMPIPEDLVVISKDDSAHTATTPNPDLESLRSRLDDIDRRLLECLRERISCCVDIADLKRRDGVAMMAPHRIAVVQERAARYAADHDIDGDFLRRLYDLVIAETCRVEDLVISTG